jgi:hypothetical protein
MRRHSPQTAKFYASNAWRIVSETVRRFNPMCQVVGCTHPAELVHHLISPDSCWERRQDWTNLVSVCRKHHGAEPGDVGRYEYSPTVLLDGKEFKHKRASFRPAAEPVPTGEEGKQFITGTPSDEEMKPLMDEAIGWLKEMGLDNL